MSLFRSMNLKCPACGADVSAQIAGSINADRRPDLRQDILENRFQDIECPTCHASFRCECDLTYIDMERGQWIAALPARQMADHLADEERSLASFNSYYGPEASEIAQEIGRSLTMRAVFGWSAFREKLLARDVGLDDVALECMKLDLLRRLPDVPLRPGVELRLDRVEADRFDLVWVAALTEEVLETLSLDRALYDSITASPEAWAALRTSLTMGPFVDMQRLFMGPGRSASIGPRAA